MKRLVTCLSLFIFTASSYAYQCTIEIDKHDDLKYSGDIYARARTLATAENATGGIAYAEYEAKVQGTDAIGPNTTGAAATLNQEMMTLEWLADASDTNGTYYVTWNFDTVPVGGGQTTVVQGSTIWAEYRIKNNHVYSSLNGVNVSAPPSFWADYSGWFNNNTLFRPVQGKDAAMEANFNTEGVAPDVYHEFGTSVNAWWTGMNPGHADCFHRASINVVIKSTLNCPEPAKI